MPHHSAFGVCARLCASSICRTTVRLVCVLGCVSAACPDSKVCVMVPQLLEACPDGMFWSFFALAASAAALVAALGWEPPLPVALHQQHLPSLEQSSAKQCVVYLPPA